MKLLFGLLLLLCAAFFAFTQWGGVHGGAGKNSLALGDLNADKIKLLEMPPAKSAPVAPPAVVQVVAASAPAAAAVSAPVVTASQPVAAASAAIAPPLVDKAAAGKVAADKAATGKICMEWGEFSGSDLTLASRALADMKLGDHLAQRTVDYDKGFWVYIPPVKGKAALNKKIRDITALGVQEYFVVPERGVWHNAISLGVFKTRDAAESFQESLKKKGLRTTKVGERKSKLKFTVFVLNRIDSATSARLGVMQKDFANSELKTIACQ